MLVTNLLAALPPPGGVREGDFTLLLRPGSLDPFQGPVVTPADVDAAVAAERTARLNAGYLTNGALGTALYGALLGYTPISMFTDVLADTVAPLATRAFVSAAISGITFPVLPAPLVLGTVAGTAAAGNDPRIVNAIDSAAVVNYVNTYVTAAISGIVFPAPLALGKALLRQQQTCRDEKCERC